MIFIFIIIYLLIGFFIASIELNLNSGDKFELFDVINTIFWLPMLFMNKEKIYLFVKKLENDKKTKI